jgi:signal peptidase I
MDKKTMAVLALLALVLLVGIGWLSAELRLKSVSPIPEGVENWVNIFDGYEAYLDQRISYAVMIGTSMAPTIKDNDTVLWVEVDNKAEFKVGDIIIYRHPTLSGLDNIAHRIIEVGTGDRENQFLTKGDNSSEEYWVPEGNIHGLVIGVLYHTALE